MQVKR
jgi:5'-AMP-activated protein kinase, catalytic alpha subunit